MKNRYHSGKVAGTSIHLMRAWLSNFGNQTIDASEEYKDDMEMDGNGHGCSQHDKDLKEATNTTANNTVNSSSLQKVLMPQCMLGIGVLSQALQT